MNRIRKTCLTSVPVLFAPLVVVLAPALDHGTAAVESFLLRLVRLVASETLPSHFRFVLLFSHWLSNICRTYKGNDGKKRFAELYTFYEKLTCPDVI